jgi:hypothetical protein
LTFRTSTAAAMLAALSSLTLSPAFAATPAGAASAPAKSKAVAKKAVKKEAEPVSATNDNLNPGQLTMADRVLTGVAECEFKEKVSIEKIEGHNGNFRLTYDRRSYVMVPEETTTGAIRLVDTGGALVWVQIPMKSMLMNQKEHHRLVDGCQQDEQRIAVQASQKAGAAAGALAPSVATPAAIAAANGVINGAALGTDPATVTTTSTTVGATTTTTTTKVKVVPPAPVKRGAAAPAAAASGMWK